MKTYSLFILTLVIALTSFTVNAQNILVVDNTPTAPSGTHIYTALQDAIDAAADGDIIHVIPSPTDYGSCVLNKNISIYGIGYTPDTETGYTSQIAFMTVEGSASGALVAGIHFTTTGMAVQFNSTELLSGFTLQSCRLSSLQDNGSGNVENIIIRNCIFTGFSFGYNTLGVVSFDTTTGATNNVVIANNIFTSETFWYTYSRGIIQAANFTIISNNLFSGNGGSTFHAFRNLTDCIVSNNIFQGVSTSSMGTAFYDNTFVNNISYGATYNDFPPAGIGGSNDGNNNLSDTDPMLTSVGLDLSWNFENNPEPQVGSPVFGAGSDGLDIGLSGGQFSIGFHGHGTPLPYIHHLGTSGLIIEGQDLNISVIARSNQ